MGEGDGDMYVGVTLFFGVRCRGETGEVGRKVPKGKKKKASHNNVKFVSRFWCLH